jgi:hypothetical protein
MFWIQYCDILMQFFLCTFIHNHSRDTRISKVISIYRLYDFRIPLMIPFCTAIDKNFDLTGN